MSNVKVQIYSDLHCEFYDDIGESLLYGFNTAGTDILIIAGDLALVKPHYKKIIPILAEKAEEVVVVLGNHEYYRHQVVGYMWQEIKKLENRYKNFRVLNNEMIELFGLKIYGGTMWFDYDPLNILYEKMLNDFNQIKNFKGWVHNDNFSFRANLINCPTPDIIVTHHMPSSSCVNSRYVGDDLNRFYYSNMNSYIESNSPPLWICGHCHLSIDKVLGETRVISNPAGYPGEYNPGFIEKYVIEIDNGRE